MAERAQEGHLVGVPRMGDGLAAARALYTVDDPIAVDVHHAVGHNPLEECQLGQVDEREGFYFNNTVKTAKYSRLHLAVARPVHLVGDAGQL